MKQLHKNRAKNINIQKIDQYLSVQTAKKIRNSLSYQLIPTFQLSQYRVTLSKKTDNSQYEQRPERKNALIHVKSQTMLKDKIFHLKDKIQNAQMLLKSQNKIVNQRKINLNQQEKKQKVMIDSVRLIESTKPVAALVQQSVRNAGIMTFSSTIFKPKNIKTATQNPYKSFRNNNYYIAEVTRAIHESNSLAVEHIRYSISLLKIRHKIAQTIADSQLQFNISLPKRKEFANRKTLILDLDETLIHCVQNSQIKHDFSLNMVIENQQHTANILIRPYAITFLKKVSKKWEVVIFTASVQTYADAILDQIDPEKQIFHHRLYRQHCIPVQGFLIKDISRINRHLSQMVIVDNAAYSYCQQIQNGIPILPFYDGKDYQLAALEGFLQKLQKCGDVRWLNKQYFKLHRYEQFDDSNELIQSLYVDSKQHLKYV